MTTTGPAEDGVGAVVVGGDYRGLGIVRSLGRHGVPVWVVRNSGEIQASASRYSRRSFDLEGAGEHEQVAFLLDLADTHGLAAWALFPTGDESAAPIARNHQDLATRYLVTIPAWDTFALGHDKRLTYKLAADLGLEFPRTVPSPTRERLADLDIEFPVIVKPAYREEINRLTLDKAWRADDFPELLRRYDEARALMPSEALLIQEHIPGGGETQLSFAALCVEGRCVASVVAQRVRQYPMDFGRASTYVVSIDDADVAERGQSVLARIGLTGLAEVEFKRDPRTRTLKLLDVNLRVWAWHTLGRRSGIDFSYLLWRVLRGYDVPEVSTPAGISWMRMSSDFPTALGEIARGRLSFRAYLRSFSPPRERAVMAKDDPIPGLLEVPSLAYRVSRRLARGERA
jgi:D-aspartate ligase